MTAIFEVVNPVVLVEPKALVLKVDEVGEVIIDETVLMLDGTLDEFVDETLPDELGEPCDSTVV